MAKAQGGWAGQALRATPHGLNSTRHSEAKSVSRPGRLLVPIYGLEVSKPTWEGCVPQPLQLTTVQRAFSCHPAEWGWEL